MVDSGFADRLALAMRKKRITQGALASALEVSQSTVSRWLAGSVPRKLVLVGIADYLNVHLDWLRDGQGQPRFFSALTSVSDFVSFNEFPIDWAGAEGEKVMERILEKQERDFGTRVHLLRRRLGLSLGAFAAKCGMTTSYLSRIESGSRSNPSGAMVGKIMKAFPVMREWLTDGQPPILVPEQYRAVLEDDTVRLLMKFEQEELQRRKEFRKEGIQEFAGKMTQEQVAATAKFIESQKQEGEKDAVTRAGIDWLMDVVTAWFSIQEKKNRKK